MSIDKFPKQPGETRDYDSSFVDYLAERSDTGASHTVVITPATGYTDISLNKVSSTLTAGVVKVFLSGGLDGSRYLVTVTLTTTGGRVVQNEFIIKVKDIK
jgi:hypothetical protein